MFVSFNLSGDFDEILPILFFAAAKKLWNFKFQASSLPVNI